MDRSITATDVVTAARSHPGELVNFWREAGPARWFARDEAFDAELRRRFLAQHEAAAHNLLAGWALHAEGALALVLLLDQFPRNAFRGQERAFATDSQARQQAAEAVALGFDRAVETALRPFFYMPGMHSEALADQERCVAQCTPIGGDTLRFALLHRDIIARFGRFPHRNAVLGRVTTPGEQAFLDAGGFAG